MSAASFYNESADKALQEKIQDGKQEMCPTSSVITSILFVDKFYMLYNSFLIVMFDNNNCNCPLGAG